MAASSYHPDLPSDKDWVRLQIGDRGPTFVLYDGEINAILAEEANKYLAAALCGDLIIAKGKGAVSKSVDNLSISYGDSPESAYRAHLKWLREKGAEKVLQLTGPASFRVL